MPLGLTRYTCPFAFRRPKNCVGLVSVMRFTAMAVAEGWTKFTVSCAVVLNDCQVRARFWLAWLTVVVVPAWAMVPAP